MSGTKADPIGITNPPIDELLTARGLRPVDFAGWKRLDQLEVERGKAAGRPRVKFARIEEMRAALATEPVR